MGIYLNPGNIGFRRALNSEIYIDKSGLIRYTNEKLFTEQQFICVSRPRRFGKSMTANMLTAYYSRGCDSKELFAELNIARAGDFEKHLNKYHVIYLNMADVPAMIIELKYDRPVRTAIAQIKEKQYFDCLKDYSGEILLVGVEYDKDSETKKHVCRIEKIKK